MQDEKEIKEEQKEDIDVVFEDEEESENPKILIKK